MEHDRSRRFYLITHPRSASNLLLRILSLPFQRNVQYRDKGGYFFLPTVLLSRELRTEGRHVKDWSQGEESRMMASYQNNFNDMEKYLQKAKAEGKIAFVKEHSGFMTDPLEQTRYLFGGFEGGSSPWRVTTPARYGTPATSTLNKTIFPDEFLKTLSPIFLVRHPALAFPSYYRTQVDLKLATKKDDKDLELWMTLRWSRILYDWYSEHLPGSITERKIWPIVLDAEDVTHRPDIIVKLCKIVGMDPTSLQLNWTPMNKEEAAELIPNVMERRFLSTVLSSSGVIKEKTSMGVVIEVEAKKWREEFGEEMGEQMEKWVRAAMPDYEFMTGRRLKQWEN